MEKKGIVEGKDLFHEDPLTHKINYGCQDTRRLLILYLELRN